MTDEERTKEQLLEELKALRVQVAALGESQKRRRRVQGALDEPMNFFQILVDTIPNPIFFKSVDGLYLGCNKAFEAFLGLKMDKVVGKSVYEIAPRELADLYSKADSELFAEPGVQIYESSVKGADGKMRDVVFHKATFSNADGTLAGLVGVILDITDRKRVETDLLKSKALFENLARISPVGIFRTDIEGRCIYVNERWCEMAGISSEEALNDGWVRAIHPEDRQRVREAWYTSAKNGRPFRAEYKFQRPDGHTTFVLGQSSAEVNQDGVASGYVGTVTDITEQKQAEEALRQSRQRFRTIFDSVGEAIFIHDPDTGKILDVNRKTCEMYGYSSEEIQQVSIEDLSSKEPPYTQQHALERLKKAAEGEPQVFEWRAKSKTGRLFWNEISIRRATIGDRDLLLVTARDITERKQAEKDLRESEGRYRELFNTVPDAVLIFDAETRQFIDVNDSAVSLYGYTRDELLRLTQADITAEPELSNASIKETLAGERVKVPLRLHRKKDGTVFPVEISTSTFIMAGRKVLCGVVRDITERRRVEEELDNYRRHLEDLVTERTNELATANAQLTREIEERKRAEISLQEASKKLKFFAYSVAHDLKSPAIGIYGLTRRLSKQSKEVLDEKSRTYCNQILKASEHIASLVDKINLYIATKEAHLLIEEVNIKEIIQMLKEEFSAQLTIRKIEWSEPEMAIEIRADRLSILRVFRNMLDNSLKYGGEQLSKIWIGYEESGDSHVFSVSDNGKGLREEDAERIFQPFERPETSRGVEGSGLGLTIVKEIAEQHGGKVWVKPLPKRGTAFYISISKGL